MTQTPDLARRMALIGVAVVATLLVIVDAVVWFSLRSSLNDALHDTLDTRARIVQAEARTHPADQLAARLQELGLRAVVRTPTQVYNAAPDSPALGEVPPVSVAGGPAWRRDVAIDGATVTVFARTAGVSRSLRELLLAELVGTLLAVVLAGFLLERAARVALRPLSRIAVAAERTAAGQRGERLNPDRPGTELGRMATAYDDMVASLESAADEARTAQEDSELLAAIVDSSDGAVVSTDPFGQILSWNHAAERIYGWSADEAVGQHIALIVPLEELAQHEQHLTAANAGGVVRRVETERLTKGGTRIPVAFTLSPVHRDGQVVATSEIARDMSEQRWMAQTLDTTLKQLEAAVAQARASEETTRMFLADAAHQLRTPIAGIRSCAELLLRGVEPEDADRLLATLVRESARAARLITGLLRIARLDQGGPVATEPVDLRSVCTDEIARAALLAPQLSMTLTGAEAPSVPADGSAVREVVANLVDNARRHAASRVELQLEPTDTDVLVRVLDDGPGVTAEDSDRVFARFVSLDGRGGSGLGLPIARGLARAMGGDVYYDAGFVLRLRRDAGDHDA